MSNEKNFGKGYSVRKEIKKMSGDIILIQDADLEYDPSDYPKLDNPILKNVAGVVFRSRFLGSDLKRIFFFGIQYCFAVTGYILNANKSYTIAA